MTAPAASGQGFSIVRELREESFIFDSVGSQILAMTDIGRQGFILKNISGVVQSADLTGTFSLAEPAPTRVGGQPFTANEAASWPGEWVGYFYSESTRTWMIMTDALGFGHVNFASFATPSGERTVITSPFFRAVATSAAKRGYSLNLNWSTLLPFMLSTTNLYASRISDSTFAREVQVLNSDSCLLINDKGMGLSRRIDPLFPEEDPDKVDYGRYSMEEWIEKGIDAAGRDMQAGLDTGLSPNLTLSGGKDSRVALSILVAHGLHKEFKVLTHRPASSLGATNEVLLKDLSIASKVVDHFGLDWYVPEHGSWRRQDFPEILDTWQRYRSNQFFEFIPSNPCHINAQEYTVGGGSGEISRIHYGVKTAGIYRDWWANAQQTRNGTGSDLAKLVHATCGAWRVDPALLGHSALEFGRSVQPPAVENAVEALPYVFIDRKNRTHDAIARSRSRSGILMGLPSARPEFRAAWTLQSQEDQVSGRVAFHTILRGCPELATLELESGPWPSEWLQQDLPDPWKQASVERATRLYETQRVNYAPLTTEGSIPQGLPEKAYARLRDNMDMLLQLAPQPEVLAIRVSLLAGRNKRLLDHMVAVTESARDVIDPRVSQVAERVVNVATVASLRAADQAVPAPAISFEEVFSSLDVSAVTAEVTDLSDGDTRRFRIALRELPDDCDVAFYLYCDGVVSQKQWYGVSDSWVTEPLPAGVGLARFTVFLKWKGHPEACRIFDMPVPLR